MQTKDLLWSEIR